MKDKKHDPAQPVSHSEGLPLWLANRADSLTRQFVRALNALNRHDTRLWNGTRSCSGTAQAVRCRGETGLHLHRTACAVPLVRKPGVGVEVNSLRCSRVVTERLAPCRLGFSSPNGLRRVAWNLT